eukprot:s379_g42.t1
MADQVRDLDPLCEEWVEQQWIAGTPLGLIGDALCGLQHYWPQLKGELRGAWKLYHNWRRIEVPQRAPPLPRSIALALVGLFLHWEQPQMAFLLALGFHTFLRTGEMLNLEHRDVHLFPRANGAVTIRKSKTGLRFNIDEAVAIYDVELHRLWELCQLPVAPPPSHHVWPHSDSAFRKLFYKGLDALGLTALKFQPYSIRRGGATHAFVTQRTLDAILLRGRWRSLAVARLYLEDGQSQLAQLQMSKLSKTRLLSFQKGLPTRLLACHSPPCLALGCVLGNVERDASLQTFWHAMCHVSLTCLA